MRGCACVLLSMLCTLTGSRSLSCSRLDIVFASYCGIGIEGCTMIARRNYYLEDKYCKARKMHTGARVPYASVGAQEAEQWLI